jgi:uncharacterized protein (TIGR02118 family)
VITRLWMGLRRSGSSADEFRSHWRDVHAGLGARLPGLRRYVQNHPLHEDGLPPWPWFDGCSELDFDDVAAMRACFDSPAMREADADEAHFADPDRFALAITRREVLADRGPGPGSVRLLTFLRANPASDAAALLDALRGPYAEAVAATGPLRHEQLVVLPEAHAGEVPPACDAVDAIWFESQAAGRAWLGSPAAVRGALHLAGHAFGTERALVTPLTILGWS